MSCQQEYEWVKEALSGKEDAFASLIADHEPALYALCLRMTRHHQDAQDVAQTSILKAWRSLSSFQGESSFYTWLYRLTHNTCIDFLRQRQRQSTNLVSLDATLEQGDRLPDPHLLPEENTLQRERRDQLYQALEALSHEHRVILLQRELDGLSYQEIAELTGLSLGTVKSRLARARLALRETLLQSGNFFPPPTSKEKTKGGDV